MSQLVRLEGKHTAQTAHCVMLYYFHNFHVLLLYSSTWGRTKGECVFPQPPHLRWAWPKRNTTQGNMVDLYQISITYNIEKLDPIQCKMRVMTMDSKGCQVSLFVCHVTFISVNNCHEYHKRLHITESHKYFSQNTLHVIVSQIFQTKIAKFTFNET